MCDPPSDLNLSSSAQSSLYLVLSLSLCICLIALILTHYFHSHRIFFSSNRLFMTTSVFGAMMVTIGAAIMIPSSSSSFTPSTCTARVWMLFLGLHLFFSSLCVKLYKLHAIFTHTKITAVHVPDKRMLIWCGISSIPLFIVLIVWSIIAPWSSTIPLPCEDNDSGFMYYCHNTQRHIFLPLLLSLIGILLCTLAYYIYHTYRIPYRYKDTTRIAFVLMNVLITFIIAISVYIPFRNDNRPPSHLKLIWVVSMLYGVASSIAILYVPMCYQLMLEWRTPGTMDWVYESKQQDADASDISHHMGLRQRIPHPVTSHSHLPWSMASARPPPMDMDAIQRQRDREMEAIDQRIASGNATMEEKLTHLMNRFDAQSTRMLSLQHEESELLMLAMRKRTEMMALRQSCLHLRMEIEYLSVNAWTQQQSEQQIQQQQQEAITQTWRLIQQQQQQQQMRERQLLQMVSVSHGTNQQPHTTGISQTMSIQPSTTATSSTRIQTQTYTSTMGSRGPLESLTVVSGIRQPYHVEPQASITSITNTTQAAVLENVVSELQPPKSGPTSTSTAATTVTAAPPPLSTSAPSPIVSPVAAPSPIASTDPNSDGAAAEPRFHF